MTRITDMRSDLQAESSEWLFKSPLAGAGAFCGGPTRGRSAFSWQQHYYYIEDGPN